jgi:hypothetical protein
MREEAIEVYEKDCENKTARCNITCLEKTITYHILQFHTLLQLFVIRHATPQMGLDFFSIKIPHESL